MSIQDYTIARNSTNFLFGPSGSGKTTLLGLITGILKPTSGELEVLGQPFHSLSPRKRDEIRGQRMGYIFQMFNLVPYLSAIDNILLPVKLSKAGNFDSLDQANTEVRALADRLQISQHLEQRVTTLSVGQQQRVAAARALLTKPELIIADEPTSALDQDRREAFCQLLFEESKRHQGTVLFVSHDRSLSSLFDVQMNLAEINSVVSEVDK